MASVLPTSACGLADTARLTSTSAPLIEPEPMTAMRSTRLVALSCILAFATTACATSGWSGLDEIRAGDSGMFVSEHYSGYEERHLGEVVRTFESLGFEPSADQETSPYRLEYWIDAGIVVTVEIFVVRDGVRVLEVSSSNYGWGTMIARPLAIAGRVEAALEEVVELLDRHG